MDKLQELTEKLYNEGLSKGKQEGEAILAKANADAQEIIAAARKEADAILDKARKDAESYRVKVEGDVKMASVQAIQTARAAVENLIVASVAGKEVEKVLSDQQFIKEVITAVAKVLQRPGTERPCPGTPREASEGPGAFCQGRAQEDCRNRRGGTLQQKDCSRVQDWPR